MEKSQKKTAFPPLSKKNSLSSPIKKKRTQKGEVCVLLRRHSACTKMSKNSVKFLKCKFRAQMKLKFGTKKSALCFISLEMGECALVLLGTKKKKKICKKGRDSILYTKVNIRYTLYQV
jgi:hypothetical protein